MARSVYSVQILSLSPALPSQTVTVPDGVRLIVRDIDACEIGGTLPAILLVRQAATGVFWGAQRMVASQLYVAQWQGRQVFNPGETLSVQVVSGSWDIQISGYELTLV